MFHCFNISKYISISVMFFITSVSCFVFFVGFLKIIAPGWGFSTMFLPQRSGFCNFFAGGGMRNLPFQKNFPGVCPGDGQAWN